jgi:formate dehydrogenase major subunit
MTMRTPNASLRKTDTLDISPTDAQRLKLSDGDEVRVRSRHGAVVLPARIASMVNPRELFATFHSPEISLNNLTGPHRDNLTMTPEYKVVAVSVEKVRDTERAINL